MRQTNLQRAADAHLRKVGSSLDDFLRTAAERGDSSHHMANELARITDIQVSNMTVYRWAKALTDEVSA